NVRPRVSGTQGPHDGFWIPACAGMSGNESRRACGLPVRSPQVALAPARCYGYRGSVSEEAARAMSGNRVKVGIVGLGRWAKVLTRAARTSDAVEIVSGFSRSQESRDAFQSEFGVKSAPDLASLLADPSIKGVILTVPNEQHLPLAREVAKAGKHV